MLNCILSARTAKRLLLSMTGSYGETARKTRAFNAPAAILPRMKKPVTA